MSRRRIHFAGQGNHGGGHGDRPWVYFMIDSFFLVTQFFVLTFQVRTCHDLIIPHTLHAGEPTPVPMDYTMTTDVAITVQRQVVDLPAVYKINGGEPLSYAGIVSQLSELTVGRNADRVHVRISSAPNVTFGDVMPIINICKKFKFKECGIQPARARE